jgi:uncharacterized coiled-coil DUF342 family protein
MSEDEFTKLYKYMQTEFKDIKSTLEQTATKEELNKLSSAVDAYAKKVDDYTQEMLMLAHKVDRLERWINKIASKTGVKLDY